MKKWLIALGTGVLLTAGTAIALANPDDTRDSIAARYGDYRLVIDTDNQPWTKDEWLTKGVKRAKPSAYMHTFTTNGLRVQMEVSYVNSKPDATVQMQRFTPDMSIKIKDFQKYFPEVYPLLIAPKSQAFSSYATVNKNFQEPQSPVTLGVVIDQPAVANAKGIVPLIVFNIQDEGRFVKDPTWITEDTYIREFIVTTVYRPDFIDHFEASNADWKRTKNYFINKK